MKTTSSAGVISDAKRRMAAIDRVLGGKLPPSHRRQLEAVKAYLAKYVPREAA
jgi:hypothetical protein